MIKINKYLGEDEKTGFIRNIEVIISNNKGIDYIFSANKGSIFIERKIQFGLLEPMFYVSDYTKYGGKIISTSHHEIFFDNLRDAILYFKDRVKHEINVSLDLDQLLGELGQNEEKLMKMEEYANLLIS
jgi:hypothetical protein